MRGESRQSNDYSFVRNLPVGTKYANKCLFSWGSLGYCAAEIMMCKFCLAKECVLAFEMRDLQQYKYFM